MKPKATSNENSRNVKEMNIPPEKKKKFKRIKKSIMKVENYKISKLLNDSFISQFVTRKWIKANDLSSGQYYFNKNIKSKIIFV